MMTPKTAAAAAAAAGGLPYTPPRFLERVRRKFVFLFRFGWVPILLGILSGAGALGVASLMPPTYVSTGRIWESEKLLVSEGAGFTEDPQTYFSTQIQLLESEGMQHLALASLAFGNTNSPPRDPVGKPLPVRIKVTQPPRSAMLVITASGSSADYTQRLLDALMTNFQSYRKNVRQSVSGMTYQSIADQLKRLEVELLTDQQAFAAFGKTHNLAILQEEGTISGSYLARLKTQLSETALEAQLLEAATRQLEAATSPGRIALGAYVLKTQVASHPTLRSERSESLDEGALHAELLAATEVAKMRMKNIQSGISEWEDKVRSSKDLIAEAERLRANVSRSQHLFERLDRLRENVDLTRNINQDSLQILEQASPPERSYKREVSFLSIGATAGLVFGLALVLFVIEPRVDRFWSAEEVGARFPHAVIAEIPRISESPLVAEASELEPLATSYRRLRSWLLVRPPGLSRPQVVCITSALPGEGKSTVAVNLAKMAAQGGTRVLLIDADLGGGAIHETLGIKAEPGLADVLAGTQQPNDVLQSTGTENLQFVARGKAPGHSTDLLMRPTLNELVARARAVYDLIIIDATSVMESDNATTVAPRVDGVLFVIGRRQAGLRLVRESVKLLAQRHATILGFVFSRAVDA